MPISGKLFKYKQYPSIPVSISVPAVKEPGEYLVIAQAKNNVHATSPTCSQLDSIEEKASFYATNLIGHKSGLSLNRWKVSREVRSTGHNSSGSFIYIAKLTGK